MVKLRILTEERPKNKSSIRWFIGMMMISVFSLAYYVAPMYMLTSLLALLFSYPTPLLSWIYVAPLFISAVLPPIAIPSLVASLTPILDYFDYEQIHEITPINMFEEIKKGKNCICVFQPHGVFSVVGICSAIMAPPEFRGITTAVADALLQTPILKHILGVFGLISASKGSMIKTLKKKGAEGCVVLYVGGMAELFLSSETEEQLYLMKRKGFIKLALTQGVDILPIYLFGNTSVLSVLKWEVLASISRKLQISLTFMWGKWGLPIPRDRKLLYVSGQPLGLPHIEKPTQEDIDQWHANYCREVTRLFDTYKERVPEYKHKKLHIV